MLAVSRGAFANIYCYIEDSAFYATYQLALGIWWSLEMQTSHHAIATHRLVVLAEVNIVPQDWGYFLFKLSLAEALEEVAKSSTEEAWLYNKYAIYISFDYIHWFNLCSFKKEFLKSSRPSLPLKKAPPFSPSLSSIVFTTPSVPLAGDRNPQGREDVTALRCSEPLRYRVGGASKPSPCFAGWDRLNCSSLQYRSALVVTRMRNIVFILLLIGLPLGRCPSGLWRKSYDRHWRLMNDHSDRGCHL